ncbi:hypothetical protein DFH08DRAFT_821291 [Mycena albidolilacea]|uniref:Uncharacterized protein n=1 Tax=Mycena albidolilacea TaxID=1033008 RepID=A0AAD6ZAH6_9AGAR|nr:hypothetical protein DFH08DRAFT_821291 [Mycena albidolilacea]
MARDFFGGSRCCSGESSNISFYFTCPHQCKWLSRTRTLFGILYNFGRVIGSKTKPKSTAVKKSGKKGTSTDSDDDDPDYALPKRGHPHLSEEEDDDFMDVDQPATLAKHGAVPTQTKTAVPPPLEVIEIDDEDAPPRWRGKRGPKSDTRLHFHEPVAIIGAHHLRGGMHSGSLLRTTLLLREKEWVTLEKLGNILKEFTNVTLQMSQSKTPTLPWVQGCVNLKDNIAELLPPEKPGITQENPLTFEDCTDGKEQFAEPTFNS